MEWRKNNSPRVDVGVLQNFLVETRLNEHERGSFNPVENLICYRYQRTIYSMSYTSFMASVGVKPSHNLKDVTSSTSRPPKPPANQKRGAFLHTPALLHMVTLRRIRLSPRDLDHVPSGIVSVRRSSFTRSLQSPSHPGTELLALLLGTRRVAGRVGDRSIGRRMDVRTGRASQATG